MATPSFRKRLFQRFVRRTSSSERAASVARVLIDRVIVAHAELSDIADWLEQHLVALT